MLVALGHSSREADQAGALQLLAGKPYGPVSLWLLGIGFAAHALWRLSEAAFGAAGERPGAPRGQPMQGIPFSNGEVISFTLEGDGSDTHPVDWRADRPA